MAERLSAQPNPAGEPDQAALVAPAKATPDLRCPVCWDEITPRLEYRPGSYSEHRDHTGYECDNYKCGAEWDNRGRNTVPSALIAAPQAGDHGPAQPKESAERGGDGLIARGDARG